MRCVDLYNQSQSKWFEEMVTTSLVRNICLLVLVLNFGQSKVQVIYLSITVF